eukprot:859197-Prymnesium_polylepis.1
MVVWCGCRCAGGPRGAGPVRAFGSSAAVGDGPQKNSERETPSGCFVGMQRTSTSSSEADRQGTRLPP